MADIGSWAARIAGAALACVASVGEASFHLFQINQIYSDTTGAIQYIEFFNSFAAPLGDGQEFLSGIQLTASSSGTTHVFTFPSNLPATPSHTTSARIFW